jgi:hypothetical protein
MINGRSRSILLQVAFKASIEMLVAGQISSDIVSGTTATLYDTLINLHDELKIDPDEGARRSGGASRGPSTPATVPTGETFIFNGHLIEDFRAAKAAPGSTVKTNYPDFKTVNGQPIEGVTTPQGAAWLYAQDGAANEAVSELVAVADQKVI